MHLTRSKIIDDAFVREAFFKECILHNTHRQIMSYAIRCDLSSWEVGDRIILYYEKYLLNLWIMINGHCWYNFSKKLGSANKKLFDLFAAGEGQLGKTEVFAGSVIMRHSLSNGQCVELEIVKIEWLETNKKGVATFSKLYMLIRKVCECLPVELIPDIFNAAARGWSKLSAEFATELRPIIPENFTASQDLPAQFDENMARANLSTHSTSPKYSEYMDNYRDSIDHKTQIMALDQIFSMSSSVARRVESSNIGHMREPTQSIPTHRVGIMNCLESAITLTAHDKILVGDAKKSPKILYERRQCQKKQRPQLGNIKKFPKDHRLMNYKK